MCNWSEAIKEQAKQECINQVASNMIAGNEEIDKIMQFTGLSLSCLEEIARSMGKKLTQ